MAIGEYNYRKSMIKIFPNQKKSTNKFENKIKTYLVYTKIT